MPVCQEECSFDCNCNNRRSDDNSSSNNSNAPVVDGNELEKTIDMPHARRRRPTKTCPLKT